MVWAMVFRTLLLFFSAEFTGQVFKSLVVSDDFVIPNCANILRVRKSGHTQNSREVSRNDSLWSQTDMPIKVTVQCRRPAGRLSFS